MLLNRENILSIILLLSIFFFIYNVFILGFHGFQLLGALLSIILRNIKKINIFKDKLYKVNELNIAITHKKLESYFYLLIYFNKLLQENKTIITFLNDYVKCIK